MERRIRWNKSLEIDEKFLEEIEEVYQIINETPMFTLITKGDAKYEFNSKEELLKYSFDEDIMSLVIDTDKFRKRNDIFFNFETNYNTILNYRYTAECKYKVENNELDSILKEKILKLYKNHTKSDWIIGKIGIVFITMIITFISMLIYLIISDVSIFEQSPNIIFFIGVVIGCYVYFLRKILDRKICDKFFTPIVYLFGFQKKKWERNLKLRGDIFWTIIMGIIISIISTPVYNIIFNNS